MFSFFFIRACSVSYNHTHALRVIFKVWLEDGRCFSEKKKTICVFCGANSGKDVAFVNATYHFGKVLGRRKIDLVYGGGRLWLMGCVSIAVARHKRQVLGIIPSASTINNLVGETCGKEIKVETMHERLLTMMELSNAFIALPGGFGTLEELFQMISWAS
ncbi:hypothetical protein PTKIN_Ptkin12aG0116200 [Pterospermum kingtungense]